MNGSSPWSIASGMTGSSLLLRPGAGRGHGLRHAQRRPILLAVNQTAELVLQRVVAHRVGLADQDLGFGRQHVAAVDGAAERFEHVVPVEHGLADSVLPE